MQAKVARRTAAKALGTAAAVTAVVVSGCAQMRRPARTTAVAPSLLAVPAGNMQSFTLAWDWPWADANPQLAGDFGARAILLWSTNVYLPLSQWQVIAVCEPHVRSTNVIVPFVGAGYFAIGATAR